MQHLTARVTRDAQVKTFESGRSVVNFNVVKNHYYKNKEGKRIEIPQFFQCSFWQSTKVAPFITKGQIIELLGEVNAGIYTDKEGNPQTIMRLKVDKITFHTAQRKAKPVNETDSSADANAPNDDLPF